MESISGFISSVMRYPTQTSTKRKKYVTFKCKSCEAITEKVYGSSFVDACSHCAKGGFTTADFIARGKMHFGERYDYSKTVYVNKRESVTIICAVHGDFQQRAQEHLDGHGCNLCKFDVKSLNQLTPKEVWLDRIGKYPGIEFKDLAQLSGYHSTATLLCKYHGEFTVQLGKVGTAVHLCRDCAFVAHQPQSIRENLAGTEATLYYVYLPDIDMYKFGVTVNLEKRLTTLGNTRLISSAKCEYVKACELEHSVHAKLEEFRYKGRKKLIKDGSTELYKQDVLLHVKRALREQSRTESYLNGETPTA